MPQLPSRQKRTEPKPEPKTEVEETSEVSTPESKHEADTPELFKVIDRLEAENEALRTENAALVARLTTTAKQVPKTVTKKDIEELIEDSEIKHPDVVKHYHETDFEKFKELYGLRKSAERRPMETISFSDEQDNRYPGTKTTILTKKVSK